MYTDEYHEKVIEEVNKRSSKIPIVIHGNNAFLNLGTIEAVENALKTLSYAKGFLRDEMKKMDLKSPLTQKYISDYFMMYTNITIARGFCRRDLALLKKQTNPQDRGNDGSGKQHWIPNCYTKHFSDENNELSRWTFQDLELGLAAPIHPNGSFREIEDHKGNHYPHYTEIILSEFETDYSEIMTKEKYNVHSPWNHMVMTLFFYLLSVRTFEQKRKYYDGFRELKENNFSGADEYISNHSIMILKNQITLGNKQEVTMFLTQDPAARYSVEGFGKAILAPYDSKHLILIKQGFSSIIEEPDARWGDLIMRYLSFKMYETTQYEDQHIYCHPDTSPFRIMPAELAELFPLEN